MRSVVRISLFCILFLVSCLEDGSCYRDKCYICTKTAKTPSTFPGGETVKLCEDDGLSVLIQNGYSCIER